MSFTLAGTSRADYCAAGLETFWQGIAVRLYIWRLKILYESRRRCAAAPGACFPLRQCHISAMVGGY
jgi:hypothetical protein